MRVIPAVTVAAVLVGSGQAAAVASGGPAATGPGVISTVAGGAGGPDPGTSVPMTPCNVAIGGGHLYIADNQNKIRVGLAGVIREMSPGSCGRGRRREPDHRRL